MPVVLLQVNIQVHSPGTRRFIYVWQPRNDLMHLVHPVSDNIYFTQNEVDKNASTGTTNITTIQAIREAGSR